MLNVIAQQQAQRAETTSSSEAQEFLDALELTRDLPHRLIQDEAGRPFEPVHIGLTQEGRTLPEQITLLLGDPVGGAEMLIQANEDRLLERAQRRLYHHLAASPGGIPRRDFLLALEDEVRARRQALERALERVNSAYDEADKIVKQWQKQKLNQHSGGGWMQTVLNFFVLNFFGGKVTLPQAVTAWNQREKLHLQQQTHTAAIRVLARFLDGVSYLVEHLEALAGQVQRLQYEVEGRIDALGTPPTWYRPWAYEASVPNIVEARLQQIDTGALVARVLDLVRQGEGDADLAQAVRAVAQEEAARLKSLGLVQLIELEAQAQATMLDNADPLVVVGQGLLEELNSHPSCQLFPTAGTTPEEALQVTSDGQPIYRLAGLNTASYGVPDRLGFVYVRRGIALSELRAYYEGHEPFQAVQSQHNIHVLEDLAEEWESRASPLSSAAAEKTEPAPDGTALPERTATS